MQYLSKSVGEPSTILALEGHRWVACCVVKQLEIENPLKNLKTKSQRSEQGQLAPPVRFGRQEGSVLSVAIDT